MAFTNTDFARMCAYIAKNASAWSSDILSMPADMNDHPRAEVVGRFTDDIRQRLDRLDKMAGRTRVDPAKADEVDIADPAT
jgi:hypothetical protein